MQNTIMINIIKVTDPKRYDDRDIHENVIKYYKYYYDKYKN